MEEETVASAEASSSKKQKDEEVRSAHEQVSSNSTRSPAGAESETERIARLLKLRRSIGQRRPEFARPESWRYARLRPNWRKPKGLDNKIRKSIKGWPRRVKVGYRGPAEVRGLHPSGHVEVLVHNPEELTRLVPEKDAARIAGAVGAKKRAEIIKRASELGVKVLNPQGLRVIESKK